MCLAHITTANNCHYSTETALLHVLNSKYHSSDQNQPSLLVSLDLLEIFNMHSTSDTSRMHFVSPCTVHGALNINYSNYHNITTTGTRVQQVGGAKRV